MRILVILLLPFILDNRSGATETIQVPRQATLRQGANVREKNRQYQPLHYDDRQAEANKIIDSKKKRIIHSDKRSRSSPVKEIESQDILETFDFYNGQEYHPHTSDYQIKEKHGNFPSISFFYGPIHLALWLALAPIRVPIGMLIYAIEMTVVGFKVLNTVMISCSKFLKGAQKIFPTWLKLVIRGVCFACWWELFLIFTAREPMLKILIGEEIKVWKSLICAAKYLPVPWNTSGISEGQLNRAFRVFGLIHHPDKNGGDSSIYLRVSEALELLKQDKKLRHFWVIARPLLAASPLILIPCAYLGTCALMFVWRPTFITPVRCLKKNEIRQHSIPPTNPYNENMLREI